MGLRTFFKKIFTAPPSTPTTEQKDEAQPGIQTGYYKCGKFDIFIPGDHKLPEYQGEHGLYDQFLPVLASCLPKNALVIDVGANVGDTYASMLSANENLYFLCIEPDEQFFSLLESNMEAISLSENRRDKDRAKKIYIGDPTNNSGELVSKNGSAKVVKSTQARLIPYFRLEELIDLEKISEQQTILVKSDVDGYDFEVISSLGKYIKRPFTILYFEAQCFTEEQLHGYGHLLKNLEGNGFLFTIMDNFGNLIHDACNASQAIDLLNYTWNQQSPKRTRTIWYVDILATHASTQNVTKHTLQTYRQKFNLI